MRAHNFYSSKRQSFDETAADEIHLQLERCTLIAQQLNGVNERHGTKTPQEPKRRKYTN